MAMKISDNTEKSLIALYQAITNKHTKNSEFRNRCLTVDRYIARESETSVERRKARLAKAMTGKAFVGNTEIPLIYTKVESALAYLSNQFLGGFPIFSPVTPRDLQEEASMIHALMIRDQARFKWVKHLKNAMRDGLKYNLIAVESSWQRKFYTTTESGQAAQRIEQEGQQYRRLNPYNLIFDTTVYPDEIAENGVYAGYVERFNFVQVKQFLSRLDNTYKINKNLAAAFRAHALAGTERALYYSPEIVQLSTAQVDRTSDFSNFFGDTSNPEFGRRMNATGTYEVVTLNLRMIPADFGLDAPKARTPAVWKAIFINGVIVYLERLPSESFPIKVTLMLDEGLGLESKSFAENLMEIQDDASALKNARLSSLRRSLSDRALYDPTRIDPKYVNTANPEAKIPVKMGAYGKDLTSAYSAIPYRDEMATSYNSEFQQALAFGDTVSGINPAQQGSFVKGNKTLQEFQETVSNGAARLDLTSLQLASDLFHDLKEATKENYIRYATQEELLDRKNNGIIEVLPEKLAEIKGRMQIADGFTSSAKILSASTVQLAIQSIAQMPDLNAEYDAAGILVHLLKNQGMEDLDDFKRPTPQQQPAAPAAPGQPAAE